LEVELDFGARKLSSSLSSEIDDSMGGKTADRRKVEVLYGTVLIKTGVWGMTGELLRIGLCCTFRVGVILEVSIEHFIENWL
jgi:hypothetical protein